MAQDDSQDMAQDDSQDSWEWGGVSMVWRRQSCAGGRASRRWSMSAPESTDTRAIGKNQF